MSSKRKNMEGCVVKEEHVVVKKEHTANTPPPPLSRAKCVQPKELGNPGIGAAPITFSVTQRMVWAAVLQGQNVMFTGPAGTGKSHLLRFMIKRLSTRSTFVTASTGIAAVNIRGRTIHSFAGVGFGDDVLSVLLEKVMKNKKACARWKRCRVLIIDEISMIHASLFDKLEAIARHVRNNPAPFGGIQLILSGDLLQLPPVSRGDPDFVFQAKCWKTVIPNTIELKQIFRQKDTRLQTALNELRMGVCSPKTKAMLMECVGRELKCTNGVQPTRLFAKKNEVKSLNIREYKKLKGEVVTYDAVDGGERTFLNFLKRNTPALECLELKIGAQVMLTRNLDTKKGLVNGSRGVVDGFVSAGKDQDPQDLRVQCDGRWPIVKFKNGCVEIIQPEEFSIEIQLVKKAYRRQVPLIMAWALTIHKCQGLTLDAVELSVKSAFECGQVYVALSRVRNLESLKLMDFTTRTIRAHKAPLAFYEEVAQQSQDVCAELTELDLQRAAKNGRYFDMVDLHKKKRQKVCKVKEEQQAPTPTTTPSQPLPPSSSTNNATRRPIDLNRFKHKSSPTTKTAATTVKREQPISTPTVVVKQEVSSAPQPTNTPPFNNNSVFLCNEHKSVYELCPPFAGSNGVFRYQCFMDCSVVVRSWKPPAAKPS